MLIFRDPALDAFRERLLATFAYHDGKLYWKMVYPQGRVKVGDVAGSVTKGGRCWVRLYRRSYPRAVLVWIMLRGTRPMDIDHEDQNPGNDRIENLRNLTHQQNMMNVPMRSVNKSGVVGVCWHSKMQKWMAFIKADGRQVYLGCFHKKEQAVSVRKQAEIQYGYSANHGKPRMNAIEKTKSAQRVFLPVGSLIPNKNNPNEMSDAEFNMLSQNIEETGMTDPILVRPVEDGKYRVIGGHHRLEVAKIIGFEDVPCTVITDPQFDDDQEKFQVVRMNVIRGKLSPEKFLKLYQSLSQKYADDVMAESFGFADQEQFKKLVGQVKTSLPEAMQKEFTEAAKEIKTIDDLSKLLNHLFSTFGDTLAYGYMLLDFGGKESVWLRMSPDTRKALLEVGRLCVKEKRTVDAIIGGMIRQMAKGKTSELLLQLIAESEPVSLPPDIKLPTEEALQSTAKV